MLTFGERADVSWRDVDLDDLGRPSFALGHDAEWHDVSLSQPGGHQVVNATAAAAMALAVGVDLAHVARALTAATPASRWRMELHERADGLVVVNDAYNANPASMAAALDALVAIGGRRGARTVAVLGEMLELGAATADDHEGVGRYAAERGVDVVVTVGDVAAGIGRGAAGVPGWAGVTIHTAGRDEALTWVRENAAAGDVLLVKASRGAALETVAEGSAARRRRGGREPMRSVLFGGGFALLISLLGTRVAITWFTRWGWGQEIRDDGPTSHHTKRGTPTMGGLVIIFSVVVGYFAAKIITQSEPSASALLLLFLFVGLGAVGFLDDFIAIKMQRSLGLRSRAKMIGQTVVALVFGCLAVWNELADDRGNTPASTHVSFLRDIQWLALPTVVAIALFWVIITGTSNAMNLIDGLDGLSTGVSILVFAAYTLVNIWQNNQNCATVGGPTCYEVRDPLDLAVVAAAITGACFGFLWWNASPAAIFMGDTGSLALGGALAGLAILTRTELLLLIIGGLLVVVTLSVMIQVSVFKVSRASGVFRKVFGVQAGHRVFRIAPLHHHFEQLGWEQVTIVIRFWIITGLCVATGLGLFYAQWVIGA